MAKKISTKVNYQVTELVNNLNEAATSNSEQKRDFFTTRALYNAKRLQSMVSKAKIGAMALILALSITACGGSTESTPTTETVTATPVATPTADSSATITTTDSTNRK